MHNLTQCITCITYFKFDLKWLFNADWVRLKAGQWDKTNVEISVFNMEDMGITMTHKARERITQEKRDI